MVSYPAFLCEQRPVSWSGSSCWSNAAVQLWLSKISGVITRTVIHELKNVSLGRFWSVSKLDIRRIVYLTSAPVVAGMTVQGCLISPKVQTPERVSRQEHWCLLGHLHRSLRAAKPGRIARIGQNPEQARFVDTRLCRTKHSAVRYTRKQKSHTYM